MGSSNGFDFDELLEQELRRHAAAGRAPSPLPAAARYRATSLYGGHHMSLLPNLVATMSTKAVIGLAVAAAAAGGGVTATVTTGSPNPVVWGQQVVQAVQGCKADYLPSSTSGQRGSQGSTNVGRCVSAFATQKGQQERALHSKGRGEPGSRPSGAASDMPTSRPTGEPTGRPTSHSTGAPTSHPAGRPSSLPASH